MQAARADHLAVIAGPASTRLGADVCDALRIAASGYECRRFPDGETQIELHGSVRGQDVYLIQATSPPVDRHILELLLIADACRRAGSARLTAVMPYFGYARQDRRTGRRSFGARVVANAIASAGFDRLMLLDAHTPAIEGFFDVPMDHLTAVPILARAATAMREHAVVVAPDFGAVKLAREYARLLQAPMAFIHKRRLDGETIESGEVIGEVRGRTALVIDDMLSTGATIKGAVDALRHAGAAEPMTVAVTHPVLAGRAREVLRALPLARFIAADTVAIEPPDVPHLEITSVAPLIATAIRRNHRDESLSDLRGPA